jgi:hypothetical protein
MTTCTLPSSDAACELVRAPSLSAVGKVIGSTAFRAILIAAGMVVLGERRRKHLVRGAIGGALMIELFVLAWTARQR